MFKALILLVLLFTSNVWSYPKPANVVQNIELPDDSIIYDSKENTYILVRSSTRRDDNYYFLYVMQYAGQWSNCWVFYCNTIELSRRKQWKVIYNPSLH